jgi:hypothetical protein
MTLDVRVRYSATQQVVRTEHAGTGSVLRSFVSVGKLLRDLFIH